MIANPHFVFLIKLGRIIGDWWSYMWENSRWILERMLYFVIQVVQKIVSLHLVLYSMYLFKYKNKNTSGFFFNWCSRLTCLLSSIVLCWKCFLFQLGILLMFLEQLVQTFCGRTGLRNFLSVIPCCKYGFCLWLFGTHSLWKSLVWSHPCSLEWQHLQKSIMLRVTQLKT